MSPRAYLLDTNIVSELARNPQGSVATHISAAGIERIGVSIVVACEVRFGITKGVSTRLADRLEVILAGIELIPLDRPVDEHYADIRTFLESNGTPIGPNDLLIAAHTRALGRVLVTNNVREFSRVPALDVENWLHA